MVLNPQDEIKGRTAANDSTRNFAAALMEIGFVYFISIGVLFDFQYTKII